MVREKAYGNIAAINKMREYPLRLRCQKCNGEAEYVQFNVSALPELYYVITRSAYCGKHIAKVAQKRGMAIYDTSEEIRAFIGAAREKRDREFAEMAEKVREMRRQEMQERGRVLVLSGYEGRMYELPDGSFLCVLNDGKEIKPCCWNWGVHLIKHNPGKLYHFPAHAPHCGQKGEPYEG